MPELSEQQRATLRRHLAHEMARTTSRIAALESDFADIVESSAEAVRDDEHDPEGATIAFERAQVAALLNEARTQLTALHEAAARLDGDGAGRCAACGGPVGFERLLARPAATRCVGCAL